VVFNPVDFDSSTGLPYIALSAAVWKGLDVNAVNEDQFVGVVSADLNLAALNDTLSKTDLYKRGYAFVWDDNGMAVIHKGLKAGLKQYDIGWVDATAGGKFDLDEDWLGAQKKGMFDKGRVSGTWSYNFKGAKWYYTFMPIEGTPYMIALSVEYSEVTETADKMLSSLNRLVVNATIIITVLLVVVCIILAIFSAWFNKNLGEKIKHLADFVGEMKTKDYSIDMPGGQAGSAELKDIADNMRQMVVALRFGHPKFAMGDKAKEFRNCIEALDIILQLDNKRGRGVCLNNMGLCLRALHTAHADATSTPKELTHHHYPQLAAVMQKIIPTYTAEAESVIDPDVFFRQSVHEAEVAAIPAAASAPAAGIGTVSATLATRLLNRAVYLITKTYITSKPKEQAMDCLEMVLKCDDIRVLTTVAWGATSDLQQALLSEEMRDTKELVLRICDRARALLAEKESSNSVDVELA